MAYGNNGDYEAGAPKKADVLIRSTQQIALKQEELSEQTKHVAERIDEAIELFNKNSKDASYIVQQSGEIFSQLQSENSALKQELLYLAKQSENIYAGLAEKITELSDQNKTGEETLSGVAEKIDGVCEQSEKSESTLNDISEKITKLSDEAITRGEQLFGIAEKIDGLSEQTEKSESAYDSLADKIAELYEQNRRNESALAALTEKLELVADKMEAVSESAIKNERAYSELSDKVSVTERSDAGDMLSPDILNRLNYISDQLRRSENARYSDSSINPDIIDKLNYISEQLRRSEGAHSMLADKFEILSMRVEQFGFESAKGSANQPRASVAPVHTVVKEELDYDKLAEKVSSLIATKTAPVQPEKELDYDKLAEKVALLIAAKTAPAQPEKELDYDTLAEKVSTLISTREVISPDYIASKVAEQIILPAAGVETANVKLSVDSNEIARQVAQLVNVNEPQPPAEVKIDTYAIARQVAQLVNANEVLNEPTMPVIDEEAIADRVVSSFGDLKQEIADSVASRVSEFKQEIADDVVSRVGEMRQEITDDVAIKLDNLKEELNDSVADKVVSIKEEIADSVTDRVITLREEIADSVADKVVTLKEEVAPVSSAVDLDEDELAEKLARKLGNINVGAAVPVVNNFDIDEEELSDRIALKLGSLKCNDFEILVDDNGCSSISKEIANNLDYNTISNIVADKLREALDLAAAAAPDYEDMAERISEKITVAGINEDAIADKAAAALSNYLPDFDSDEIADKITGAVIDVVSAIPQPTIDSEAICNTISERLIESQEDHDYDIVIDDEGISKITDLVAAEIEKDTSERFTNIEEQLAKISELVKTEIDNDTGNRFDAIDEELAKISSLVASDENDDVAERFDKIEDELTKISELITSEDPNDDAADRFDIIEDGLNKISEMLEQKQAEEQAQAEAKALSEEIAVTEAVQKDEVDYTALTEIVAAEIEKGVEGVSTRLNAVEENIAKLTEVISSDEAEEEYGEDDEEAMEAQAAEEEAEYYAKLSEVVAAEIEKGVEGVSTRLNAVEENIAKLTEVISSDEAEEEYSEEDEEALEAQAAEEEAQYYAKLSEVVAAEIEKGVEGVSTRLNAVEENIAKLTEVISSDEAEEEYGEEDEEAIEAQAAEEEAEYYAKLSEVVAAEIEKGVSSRLDNVEQNIAKINEIITSDECEEYEDEEDEEALEAQAAEEEAQYYAKLSEVVAAEIEKGVSSRLDNVEQNIAKINEIITSDETEEYEDEEALEAQAAEEEAEYYAKLSEVVAAEIEKGVSSRLDNVEQNIAKINEIITSDESEEYEDEEYDEEAEQQEYYAKLSEVVAAEIEKGIEGVSSRLDNVEQTVAKLNDNVTSTANNGVVQEAAQEDYSRLSEVVAAEIERGMGERFNKVDADLAKVTELVAYTDDTNARFDKLEEDLAKLTERVKNGDEGKSDARFDKIEEDIAKISALVADGAQSKTDDRLDKFEEDVAQIKDMLANGIIAANVAADEAAAAQAAQSVETLIEVPAETEEVEEPIFEDVDEQPSVVEEEVPEEAPAVEIKEQPVSQFEEFEEDEEEEDDDDGIDGDDDDFTLDVFDMDKFSDDELMPNELNDLPDGVDFANMMKFKRSFIARIIQSSDEYKQYYGEVKHALISYKKVNSNVAWGAERFNKGRETIARMKIRGKTLVLYLALDPNNYKTSVYHHLDVSDNKSVAGTPMMVKVKSNLGVRKAIRLIDEMLALRNGEKKEIPERDYASMYPYETIEELIEEGLVKDVRKK